MPEEVNNQEVLTNQARKEEVIDKKPKKRHGVLKGTLLFFGGFLTCIVTIGISAVCVGAFVPAEKVTKAFGLDLSTLLTDEYAHDTVLQLISHARDGDFNFKDLGDIAAVTPLLDKYIQKIQEILQKNIGVSLDLEELYEVEFDGLGDYLATYAKENTTLATLLKVDENSTSRALIYLCFHKDEEGNFDFNHPRTLQEMMAENAFANLINTATLGDLVDVGTSGVLWALRNSQIGTIKDDVQSIKLKDLLGIKDTDKKPLPFIGGYSIQEILDGAINNATVGDLFDLKETDLLYKFSDSKISELQNDVKNAPLEDLMDIPSDPSDPNYNATLDALRYATLNTMSTEVNNLKIHQMIKITDDSSQALKYFRDYNDGEGVTLQGLDGAIKAMTLGDAVEIDQTDPNTPQILITLKGELITNLSNRINNLTLGEAIKITDGSSSFMKELATTNINDLDGAINNMELYKLIGFDMNDTSVPKILRLIGNYKLNNIQANINNINIKDLFTEDGQTTTGNKFLDALPNDTTLDNFKDKLEEVTITEVFIDDIWGSNASSVVREAVTPEEEAEGIKGDIIGGYISSVAGANTNYTLMDSTWKYMLTSEDTINGIYLHTEYTLTNNMNDLTENMKNNISTATIRELNDDGFITISDPSILDKVIPGDSIPVGDYTIKGLLDALGTILVDP